MNKYLSDKLKAFSFLLIVLVVYLHGSNLIINMQGGSATIKAGYNSFIQYFISVGVAKIAVPIFFMISGYLFFLNINKATLKEYGNKLKKRFRSLVVPYFFWSAYGLLFYLVLQSIPPLRPFFSKDLIVSYSFLHLLYTLIIDPITYQLWFIKDLFVLVVLSPIIYLLLTQSRLVALLFFFTGWLFSFSYVFVSNEAAFFFVIGATLGIYKILPPIKTQTQKLVFFIISWLTLLILETTLRYKGLDNSLPFTFLEKTTILIGIVTVWFLFDTIFKNIDISKTRFYQLFQFTFFLYAFHEPVLTVIKKALYYVLGQSELNSLLIYILSPIFTIIFGLLCGYFLKKLLPKFYYVITGGR